jgi:hypothetical protein
VNVDPDLIAGGPVQPFDPTARKRIERAYALPSARPPGAVWCELIARSAFDNAPIKVHFARGSC